VEAAFATLAEKELAPLNKRLESKQMPAISIAQVSAPVETARGGSASVLARGLVGPRFIGTLPQPARGKRRARQ
jgi:hypothetical protein